jgi:hypothetical protein
MLIQNFAKNVATKASTIDAIIGVAAGGSFITNELDEFSDLDLVVLTQEKVGGNKALMLHYAHEFGDVLTAFTGEHVGEPRLLICLYNNPFLHVDLKFVTLDEFKHRVENPIILFDRAGQLQQIIAATTAVFPYPDYQWMADRFWVWIHYALLKTGRGELTEAIDFLSFLRMSVLGPLLHIKNKHLPRGVRKVEQLLPSADLAALQSSFAVADRKSILTALRNCINLYNELSSTLFPTNINVHSKTAAQVMIFWEQLESKVES